MKPVFRSNLFAMIIIINVIIGGILLEIVFKLLRVSYGIQLVLQEVILLLIPVIIYFLITKLPIRKTLRLNSINLLQIVIIIAIGIFIQPVAQLIGVLSQFLSKDYVGSAMASINTVPIILKISIVALTPAICEELVFRGIIFSGYKSVSITKSMIIIGLFFGMFHLNLQQFFYAFALGALLTYLVHITDSIFSSMTFHFVFNGFQIVMQYIATFLITTPKTKAATSFTSLSSTEIVAIIIFEVVLASIFTPIVAILILKLKKISTKNNNIVIQESSYSKEEIQKTNSFRELLSWPAVVIMVIFILFLLYLQFRR